MTIEIASCGFSWALWKEFKALSEWADLIHYQFPWPFADFLALTRQSRKKPYIVSYQSDIVRQKGLNNLYEPLMRWFLDNAASVVASSPSYISSSKVLSNLKQPPALIPNGVGMEPKKEAYELEKADYESLYGNDFYLFIGVFRYYKGLQYLLEAAKISGLPVVIVGDGPEAGNLHSYVQEHELKNVHFLGHVNDEQKYALIALSRALILPSSQRSEAYGMVLLEAARQGTALISTELESGTSYINQHNKTGLVVQAKSASALASAMNCMAENDSKLSEFSIAAKQRFDKYFTSDVMGENYVKLYQSILSQQQVHN